MANTKFTGVRFKIPKVLDNINRLNYIIRNLDKKIEIKSGSYAYVSEYKQKSRKNYEINDTTVQRLLDNIKKLEKAGAIKREEAITLRSNITETRIEYEEFKKVTTTSRQLLGTMLFKSFDKMFYNMQINPAEVAVKYSIDINELYNEELYDNNPTPGIVRWTGPNKEGVMITLEFTFDYNGINSVRSI